MGFSISLFAIGRSALAKRLDVSNALIDQVLTHIQQHATPTDEDLQRFKEFLQQGIGGCWPTDGTTDSFETFCWLMDAIAEKFDESEISHLRTIAPLDEIGLLDEFTDKSSPIALPRNEDPIPFVKYLPVTRMQAVIDRFQSLPDPTDEIHLKYQTLFLDLIESLEPDGLDLYLVVKW